MCMWGGGGRGRMKERVRVDKIVQKGHSSRVRLETVRSLYQFLEQAC